MRRTKLSPSFLLGFAVHRLQRKLEPATTFLNPLAKQRNLAMKLDGSLRVNFSNVTSKLKSCILYPLLSDGSGLNQAGTMFVAKVKHPAGDIAQLLVLHGLGRCADWMSPLIGGEGMQKLRDAER
jgi:hypothetical protein